MLGPEKKVYFEIGVYDGGSLSFTMQHPYETELHGVDPLVLPGQVEHTFANVGSFNTHRRKITVHQRYSHDPKLWRELDGLMIDPLFIDGDHQASSSSRTSNWVHRHEWRRAASSCSTTTSTLSARQRRGRGRPDCRATSGSLSWTV
jgi:hypothetical protein